MPPWIDCLIRKVRYSGHNPDAFKGLDPRMLMTATEAVKRFGFPYYITYGSHPVSQDN